MSTVTVESSQPAPAPQPAQSAPPQSASNQSVRIAALVVLGLLIVGVFAYLIWGRDDNKHNSNPGSKNVATYIPPTGFTSKALAQESKYINTKFYWAGKQQGTLYEFTRTKNGFLYVRYLPGPNPENKVGDPHANYLIVATYPFPGAFKALKDQAGAKAVAGPDKSIVFVRPGDRRTVLMAFPGIDKQIEIFSPQAPVAIATAESGKIKPVRSN